MCLRSIREIGRLYGVQPTTISHTDLLAASQAIADSDDVLLHDRFSPAEILVALAQAVVAFDSTGRVPDSVSRTDAMGPTRNLLWYPEAQGYPWATLVQRAREVLDHVAQTGHLPALSGEPGERVSANHLYGALAASYPALCAGHRPAQLQAQELSEQLVVSEPRTLWVDRNDESICVFQIEEQLL